MARYWVQYFGKSAIDDSLIEKCGSDGVFITDGRYSRERVEQQAIEHAKSLNERVGADILGYQVMRGSILDGVKAGTVNRI